MEINIPFLDSITGFTRKVKHLDGSKFEIYQPSPVRHDDILVIKGYGMPKVNEKKKGDLYVKLNVEHPRSLTLDTNKKQRLCQLLTGQSLKDIPTKSEIQRPTIVTREAFLEEISQKVKADEEKAKYKNKGIPMQGFPGMQGMQGIPGMPGGMMVNGQQCQVQ